MTSNPEIKIFKTFLYSGSPITEKQKRTHKFEISTIARTDKTDMETTFFSQSADVFC